MNEKQLMGLAKLLRAAKEDCGVLSVEEVNELARVVEVELYVQRVQDFKKFLSKVMPDGPNSTPEQEAAFEAAMNDFYELDWTISFGGHSVTLHNDATVYNGVFDLLSEYIDDCL